MCKPKIYYVNGTAFAEDGEHLFKGAKAGFRENSAYLKSIANVIELLPNEDGEYRLEKEGSGLDYGECYLVATGNIAASGGKGQGGSIGVILSPIGSYYKYEENIQAIKELLDICPDRRLDNKLRRLLFIGVCGELEGYLSSTIIALIQGVRDVFLSLRDYKPFQRLAQDEQKRRDEMVDYINDHFQFQHIHEEESKERGIYEALIGEKLLMADNLEEFIIWRNKLAHKVPYFSYPIYPTKQDVLSFIEQTDALVDFIDERFSQYKNHWLSAF